MGLASDVLRLDSETCGKFKPSCARTPNLALTRRRRVAEWKILRQVAFNRRMNGKKNAKQFTSEEKKDTVNPNLRQSKPKNRSLRTEIFRLKPRFWKENEEKREIMEKKDSEKRNCLIDSLSLSLL